MQKRYDLVIVGAGPVGGSLALAFARYAKGARIALVDRRPLEVPRDSRATAIAAGGRRLFEALGLWPALAAAAEPVNRLAITDSGLGDIARPLFLDFSGDVAPGEPFAHMVPNPTLAGAMLEALTPTVDIIAPATITGWDGTGPRASLTLEGGDVLEAPLIVAADGAASALRTMAGIATIGHDYDQSGIATTISHALPHDGVAYEHFRPAGPFASLPLPGNRSSLVWTESRQEAARLAAMTPEDLAPIIEAVMGSTLGAVEIVAPVMAFPLRLQVAQNFVGPRLALVGDAAHVIHPIAGQGLNLGLKDVAALAEVVIEAMRLGLDHGSDDVLARYQRWRRFDTATLVAVTDGMNRLFSNDLAPVRAIRDLGLGLVDRAGPLKDAMIRAAAGLDANGPRLLNGTGI
jgi:2-octaprenyl-6-methoxyphenol hydroxylase